MITFYHRNIIFMRLEIGLFLVNFFSFLLWISYAFCRNIFQVTCIYITWLHKDLTYFIIILLTPPKWRLLEDCTIFLVQFLAFLLLSVWFSLLNHEDASPNSLAVAFTEETGSWLVSCTVWPLTSGSLPVVLKHSLMQSVQPKTILHVTNHEHM